MTQFLTTSLKFSANVLEPLDARSPSSETGKSRIRRSGQKPTSDKLLAIVNRFDGRTDAYWYSDWLAWDWAPEAAR